MPCYLNHSLHITDVRKTSACVNESLFTRYDLLHCHHCGFVSGSGTPARLDNLPDLLHGTIEKKNEEALGLFLDVEKALNTVVTRSLWFCYTKYHDPHDYDDPYDDLLGPFSPVLSGCMCTHCQIVSPASAKCRALLRLYFINLGQLRE